MNIYLGNVDFKVKEEQLTELFTEYGEVTSVKVITDKLTGRSKGFAFVEMPNDDEAKEAISNLNGYMLNSRELSVSVARPKEDKKPFRSDYGGGRSNNGGSRGGYERR
ncbi:MAG TPA: RNA-binding protein [Bacteroidales bacterium]|nr:RNA-binding protein [Bacteroidales bacterium]